jgi:CheY-like chemotaxis protein
VFVKADELRLAQALTNVLNNAARYTEAGGKIALSLYRENGFALLSVRDTGQGIAPEFMGSIFGMFIQGRGALTRPQTGLGVGLALARTIVELHHGTIEAKSEGIGKGSEFIIRLPVEAALKPSVERRKQAGKNGRAQAARRVLVVDDNVDAAVMLAALVRHLGHDVLTVHDGQQALRVVESYRPDVILLDIGMPGLNGFEVAKRLREQGINPAPRIVAVTGWGKPEDQARSREAGFDMHLMKPVEEAQIRAALATDPANGTLH